MTQVPNNLASYIWSLADLLRGDFKQSQYGRIILPFTLLRRLEGVLKESKTAVLAEVDKLAKMNLPEEAEEKTPASRYGWPVFFQYLEDGSFDAGLKVESRITSSPTCRVFQRMLVRSLSISNLGNLSPSSTMRIYSTRWCSAFDSLTSARPRFPIMRWDLFSRN